MAKNSIGRRMSDFYFELTDPDGKTQVFSSAEADEDDAEEQEENSLQN
jgi:hypothetical protein